MTTSTWPPAGTILLGEYGSRAHGTDTEDSDSDLAGVFAEPRRFVTGLDRFENTRRSTAGEHNKSSKDDVDIFIYGLRNFVALVSAGNPNVYPLLWLPKYLTLAPAGELLAANRDLFLSQHVPHRFLGYLTSQKLAMLGERGAKVHRPDLVAEHGFDVKFGYHTVRLGLQGLELMQTGALALPITGERLTLLRGIRAGKYTLDDVLVMADGLIADIERELETTDIPGYVDRDAVNTLLDDVYDLAWETTVYDDAALRLELEPARG